MAPSAETNVIGRHGKVFSHDVIGREANKSTESVKEQLRSSALRTIRETVKEEIADHGLVSLADMDTSLSKSVQLYEQLSPFVDNLSIDDVTAEYLATLTKAIIEDEDGELTPEDCDDFYTGLASYIPELNRAA